MGWSKICTASAAVHMFLAYLPHARSHNCELDAVVHFFAEGHVRGSRKMFRISKGWIGLIEGVEVSFTLGMREAEQPRVKERKVLDLLSRLRSQTDLQHLNTAFVSCEQMSSSNVDWLNSVASFTNVLQLK